MLKTLAFALIGLTAMSTLALSEESESRTLFGTHPILPPASPQKGELGRFQMRAAGGTMFLLDTATGRSWVFAPREDGNSGWYSLPFPVIVEPSSTPRSGSQVQKFLENLRREEEQREDKQREEEKAPMLEQYITPPPGFQQQE